MSSTLEERQARIAEISALLNSQDELTDRLVRTILNVMFVVASWMDDPFKRAAAEEIMDAILAEIIP